MYCIQYQAYCMSFFFKDRMMVKGTHQGIFRAIHCGPICWFNEEKCGLNGAPLYWREVLLSQGSEQSFHCGVEYTSQDAFTVNTLYAYSDQVYFAITSGIIMTASSRLMQKKQENIQVKEREVLLWRTGRWAALTCGFNAGSFKYIVVIVLSCIYAAVE